MLLAQVVIVAGPILVQFLETSCNRKNTTLRFPYSRVPSSCCHFRHAAASVNTPPGQKSLLPINVAVCNPSLCLFVVR